MEKGMGKGFSNLLPNPPRLNVNRSRWSRFKNPTGSPHSSRLPRRPTKVYTYPLRMRTRNKLPEAALEFFRKKGRIGGTRRAANLTAEQRSEQARNAVLRSPPMGKAGSEGQKERREMTLRIAVLYARVSSREQREEGFSIEAQVKLLRAAALKDGLEIVREFIEIESAKAAGRKQFAEMVSFFKRNRMCRVLLLVEKDGRRLYRNQRDALTLEDLDIRIHFVKENETLSKDAKSQVKFMHG